LLAFQETIDKGDREVAILLNSRGYRTTGNRGTNLFSRDTVRDMLQNRFYIAEPPDGNGSWIKGKHKPLVPPEILRQHRRLEHGEVHGLTLFGLMLRRAHCPGWHGALTVAALCEPSELTGGFGWSAPTE